MDWISSVGNVHVRLCAEGHTTGAVEILLNISKKPDEEVRGSKVTATGSRISPSNVV